MLRHGLIFDFQRAARAQIFLDFFSSKKRIQNFAILFQRIFAKKRKKEQIMAFDTRTPQVHIIGRIKAAHDFGRAPPQKFLF